MSRKVFEDMTRRLLEIEILTVWNSFVGILIASGLTRRYLGPPMASEVMIKDMHTLMGKMDEKLNVLLAGPKPDGGKAPPEK